MASERVQAAYDELRAALIEDGDDEGTADARVRAARPKVQTTAGNIADLMRAGAGTMTTTEEEAGSWEDYTKAELQAELEAQGIEYASSDTKADLIAKLEAGG